MNLSILNQAAIMVVDAMGFLLAFWVLSVNFREKTNRYFASMIVAYLAWISFYYLMRQSNEASEALMWAKLGFTGVTFFILFLYLFAKSFLREEKTRPILNTIIVFGAFVFAFLAAFTNLIAGKVEFLKWGPNPVLTGGAEFFFFCFVLLNHSFIGVYKWTPGSFHSF